MIFKCERCNCEFEVVMLSAGQEIGSAVCANCGYGAVKEKETKKGEVEVEVQDLENNFRSF